MTRYPWACIIIVLASLGALRAESVVIYGTTPETTAPAVEAAPVVASTTPGDSVTLYNPAPAPDSTPAAPDPISNPKSNLTSDAPAISVNDQPVAVEKVVLSDPEPPQKPSNYPWRKKIVTTTFWVGQDSTGYNDTTNYASAWDSKWTQSYGGTDNPTQRFGFLPKGRFAVTQNPFYVALPFNDVKFPDLAKKWVPWYNAGLAKQQRYSSQCKGRWIEIRNADGKSCFAQWQDVGPFRYDHAAYVFGKERPNTYNKAGLDVSPAVKTFLGLVGLDLCDWRFVEAWEVREGPWITYGEQAIVMAAIKQQEQSNHKNTTSSANPASASTKLARSATE